MRAVEGERSSAEGIGREPWLSVCILAGLLPVGGRKLEDAGVGPRGKQAEEIAEVGPGLKLVQATAGEERDEGRVDLGRLVGADEEPVAAPDHLAPELQLARVVVERQSAVVEKAPERGALVARGADRLRERRAIEALLHQPIAPPPA